MATPKPETVTDLVAELSIAIAQRPEPIAPDDTMTDLKVTDAVSYQRVGLIARACANKIGEIEAKHNPSIKKAHELHSSLIEDKKAELAPYVTAKDAAVASLNAFDREQKRLKAAADAEAQRKQDELNRQAEAQRQEALRLEQQAKALVREGDVRAAKVVQQQAQAAVQQVAEIKEQAVAVTPAIVPSVKADGIGSKEPWIAIIEDPDLLYAEVKAGRVPLMHYVPQRGGPDVEEPCVKAVANEKMMLHFARRLQSTFNTLKKFPGVRAEQDVQTSVRKG